MQNLIDQLRSKNNIIKTMKRKIRKLNGTIPTEADDFDELEGDDWAW